MIEIVTRDEREQELLQKARCFILNGDNELSQNIAYLLERRLFSAGVLATVLDWSKLSNGVCRDSVADDEEFQRRYIEVVKLFLQMGIVCIATNLVVPEQTTTPNDYIYIDFTSSESESKNRIAIEIETDDLEATVHSLYKKITGFINA